MHGGLTSEKIVSYTVSCRSDSLHCGLFVPGTIGAHTPQTCYPDTATYSSVNLIMFCCCFNTCIAYKKSLYLLFNIPLTEIRRHVSFANTGQFCSSLNHIRSVLHLKHV